MSKCTAFLEDLSSTPRTHVGWLITSCNSSSRGSNTLFWVSWETPNPSPTKKNNKILFEENEKDGTYIHILLL